MIIELLAGIAIAASAFAAWMWCTFRAATEPKLRARIAHGLTSLLILGGMACITYSAAGLALIIGPALIAAGLTAAFIDRNRTSIFPIAAALFGAILTIGLPF